MINTTKPNPGTKEAQDAGCTCPVIDNHYGRGYHGVEGQYAYNMSCPIHSMTTEQLQDMMGITN